MAWSEAHPHFAEFQAWNVDFAFCALLAIFRASNPKNRAGAAAPVGSGRSRLHPHFCYVIYALFCDFVGIEPPKSRVFVKLRFPKTLWVKLFMRIA
ncbi:MAG: hypothetical protein MSR67_09465 [Oscillospiraceae bacterium]|nr:hypothetical protein [Oscillospiraceae bacterium]